MRKIILLMMMIIFAYGVTAETTQFFLDDFDDGDAYNNGWSAISGTCTESISGRGSITPGVTGASMGQTFSSMDWSNPLAKPAIEKKKKGGKKK